MQLTKKRKYSHLAGPESHFKSSSVTALAQCISNLVLAASMPIWFTHNFKASSSLDWPGAALGGNMDP
jgi:hypothetical protein